VPGLGPDSALILELCDEAPLAPTDFSGQVAEGAVLAVVFESHDPEGIWDDQLLLEVIGGGDTLEHLELAQSGSTSCGEPREHTSDGPPEDARWTSVVHEACSGVGVAPLPQELAELDSIPEKGSGNVNALGSDDDDSLSCITKRLYRSGVPWQRTRPVCPSDDLCRQR
jgi:hypothetical protein